jgi:hypothetical protein
MTTRCYEIFWDDLTESTKQAMIMNGFYVDDNIDMSPLAIIDYEEED